MWPDVYGSKEAVSATDPSYVPSHIVDLVDVLRLNLASLPLVQAACCALLCILRSETAKRVFVEHGGARPLLDVLDLHKQQMNIVYAACIAASLLSQRDAHASVMLKEGAFQIMTRVFDACVELNGDVNHELSYHVFYTLFNLERQSDGLEPAVEAENLTSLVDAFRRHMTNATVMENLCMLRANMLTSPPACQAFLKSGGMELLVQALRTHPACINVVGSACSGITSIVGQTNKEFKLEDDMGALPLVVNSLRRFSNVEESRLRFYYALTGLCTYLYVHEAIKAGFVSPLVNLLKHEPDINTTVCVCSALGCVTLPEAARLECWNQGVFDLLQLLAVRFVNFGVVMSCLLHAITTLTTIVPNHQRSFLPSCRQF
jgi:hypothetical protein